MCDLTPVVYRDVGIRQSTCYDIVPIVYVKDYYFLFKVSLTEI